MGRRPIWPLAIFLLAALWPLRQLLTAESIARRAPAQALPAAALLVALYVFKSLTVVVPLSALTAAGGLLFPYPAALAVNALGVAAAQAAPFFLGRRGQSAPLNRRMPLPALPRSLRWRDVFLLRLAGIGPGDAVSWLLGSARVPWGVYLSAGTLGSLPRTAAATALGTALASPDPGQLLSTLGAGAALSVLAAALWRIAGRA